MSVDCSWLGLIVDMLLPWLQVGRLPSAGYFGIQVSDEICYPSHWRSGTQNFPFHGLQAEQTDTFTRERSHTGRHTSAPPHLKTCVLTRHRASHIAGWSWCSSTLCLFAPASCWNVYSISWVQNHANLCTQKNDTNQAHCSMLFISCAPYLRCLIVCFSTKAR